MVVPKVSWSKVPKPEKGDVICTRLILPAVFPAVKKTRNSKGFCSDNLSSVNVRAEQSREGRDRHCFQFRYTPLPGRKTIPTCLPKSMVIVVPTHAPGSHKCRHTIPTKRGCCQESLHPLINYLDLYLSISSRILNSCSCSSGVLADRNS